MAEIKGIIYFILGLVVASLSFYINSKTDGKAFLIFVYIGIFMIVVGVVKMLIDRINEEKNVKRYKSEEKQQQQALDHTRQAVHHQMHKMQSPHQKTPEQAQHYYNKVQHYARKFCQKCGSAAHDAANFCYHCGQRIFK